MSDLTTLTLNESAISDAINRAWKAMLSEKDRADSATPQSVVDGLVEFLKNVADGEALVHLESGGSQLEAVFSDGSVWSICPGFDDDQEVCFTATLRDEDVFGGTYSEERAFRGTAIRSLFTYNKPHVIYIEREVWEREQIEELNELRLMLQQWAKAGQ
jgi:hypothetical protein